MRDKCGLGRDAIGNGHHSYYWEIIREIDPLRR